MSFGPSQQEKAALSKQADIADAAKRQADIATGAGQNLLNLGGATAGQGLNFFRTLLSGNRANTTALLQPDIDRIRSASRATLEAISTLMPRGGGRTGALFEAATRPQADINSLFTAVRPGAAQTLLGAGLEQQGLGTNLFNAATSSLGAGTNANSDLMSQARENRRLSNSLWSGLGSGIFGLLTTPFGKGGSVLNRLPF